MRLLILLLFFINFSFFTRRIRRCSSDGNPGFIFHMIYTYRLNLRVFFPAGIYLFRYDVKCVHSLVNYKMFYGSKRNFFHFRKQRIITAAVLIFVLMLSGCGNSAGRYSRALSHPYNPGIWRVAPRACLSLPGRFPPSSPITTLPPRLSLAR